MRRFPPRLHPFTALLLCSMMIVTPTLQMSASLMTASAAAHTASTTNNVRLAVMHGSRATFALPKLFGSSNPHLPQQNTNNAIRPNRNPLPPPVNCSSGTTPIPTPTIPGTGDCFTYFAASAQSVPLNTNVTLTYGTDFYPEYSIELSVQIVDESGTILNSCSTPTHVPSFF